MSHVRFETRSSSGYNMTQVVLLVILQCLLWDVNIITIVPPNILPHCSCKFRVHLHRLHLSRKFRGKTTTDGFVIVICSPSIIIRSATASVR